MVIITAATTRRWISTALEPAMLTKTNRSTSLHHSRHVLVVVVPRRSIRRKVVAYQFHPRKCPPHHHAIISEVPCVAAEAEDGTTLSAGSMLLHRNNPFSHHVILPEETHHHQVVVVMVLLLLFLHSFYLVLLLLLLRRRRQRRRSSPHRGVASKSQMTTNSPPCFDPHHRDHWTYRYRHEDRTTMTFTRFNDRTPSMKTTTMNGSIIPTMTMMSTLVVWLNSKPYRIHHIHIQHSAGENKTEWLSSESMMSPLITTNYDGRKWGFSSSSINNVRNKYTRYFSLEVKFIKKESKLQGP